MASLIQKNFRARKSFAKLDQVIDIPNLIDIQKRSYDKFLQIDIPIEKREDIGLQAVFKSVFPIEDFNETASLEFVSYTLEKPKYDVDECRQRGMTFAAPIKVIDPPRRVRRRRGDRRRNHPRHQGAGSLHRRNPADDRDRLVHHQRHRARHRLAAAPFARACSSTTTRARPTPAARSSTRPASSRIAARGSTSSSTTKTSCTSASTAAVSCRRRSCCARSATRREELLELLLRHGDDPLRDEQEVQHARSTRAPRRSARDERHRRSEDRRSPRQEEPQVHQGRHQASIQEAGVKTLPIDMRRAGRQGLGSKTSSTRRPAKSSSSATRS